MRGLSASSAWLKARLRAGLPPRLYYALRVPVHLWSARSGSQHLQRRERRIAAAVRAGHGDMVQAGPFRGMRYLRLVSWGQLAPKLLGSYEAELHLELEQLISHGYDRVINVGCAEGYYAVGFARRLPGATVFAFDSDPYARHLCRRLAAKNRVQERMRIEGTCEEVRLTELIRGRTLLMVDCEGCEMTLLRPGLVPDLAQADLVVELHDFVDPAISETIMGRFSTSHDVTIIESITRDPSAYPALATLASDERVEAVAEHRPGVMQWVVLRARDGSSTPSA